MLQNIALSILKSVLVHTLVGFIRPLDFSLTYDRCDQ